MLSGPLSTTDRCLSSSAPFSSYLSHSTFLLFSSFFFSPISFFIPLYTSALLIFITSISPLPFASSSYIYFSLLPHWAPVSPSPLLLMSSLFSLYSSFFKSPNSSPFSCSSSFLLSPPTRDHSPFTPLSSSPRLPSLPPPSPSFHHPSSPIYPYPPPPPPLLLPSTDDTPPSDLLTRHTYTHPYVHRPP